MDKFVVSSSRKEKPKKLEAPPVKAIEPSDNVFEPDYQHIFDDVEHFKSCLEPSWRHVLASEFKESYFPSLLKKVRNAKTPIYPPNEDVLNAFKYTPFNDVKVVIIGQDPYIKKGQAHGLSFSVQKGVAIPPSLRNIYKELARTLGDKFTIPKHGYLEKWARQGVFMLNATLTVTEGASESHASFGWNNFTSAAIKAINKQKSGVVFIAWGAKALNVCKGIDKSKHLLLQGGHPSPLNRSVPFEGCDHFRKANEFLVQRGQTPIDWNAIND